LVGALAETVLGEDVRRAAERVGRDDIGAGVQIGRVDAADHVRAREVQVLVAALVRGATEVCGGEARRLDHGAHGAVEDEDALPERVAKRGHRGIVTYMTIPTLSLDGIRVLDCSRVLAGPFCGMLLADLGADVIKVEDPGSGDESRTWPPHKEGESAAYLVINRNKRDITLDLKSAEGVEVLTTLVGRSDVLIENFRTGTMESFGLGYALLHRERTGLGQRVDGSLLETAVALLNYHAEGYLLTGAIPTALGSSHPSLSPYRNFRCRDGQWVFIAGANDRFWQRLV